jgi:hypothetical protein
MSTRTRLAALEAKHPGFTRSADPLALPDKALARAAGAPWLLACTDAELVEIAQGVRERNPARYREIAEAASKRPAPPF